MTIGERIKSLRTEKKISQAQLAKNINVSPGNVGDWERGRAKPSADALIALMEYFSVSSDWLLTGDNRKSSEHNNPYTLTLDEEEKDLVLSFRCFDELDKELILNTVYTLLKKLEKNSISNSCGREKEILPNNFDNLKEA